MTAPPEARPNPEVVAQAKRRRYTAEYKQRVLADADRARDTWPRLIAAAEEALRLSVSDTAVVLHILQMPDANDRKRYALTLADELRQF